MWPRLLMVACLSTAQSTIAEVTSTIKGQIEDTKNWSLPNGVVRLDSLSLGLSREVVADVDGMYEFRAVPPAGDYIIRLDYPGFAPVEVGPVVVEPGERLFLPLVLRSDAATEVVLGGRTLVDDELQLYLRTEERISEAFRGSDGKPTIELIVSALHDVDDLPEVVSEDTRWVLESSVSSELGIVEPGDPLVCLLLSDPDARIQSMAIDLMLKDTEAWLSDPAMRSCLQGILRSPPEGTELVAGILFVYGYADRFSEVLPLALDLARSLDAEFSREVAGVIAWNHAREADLAGLKHLFLQTDGILRQAAAPFLAGTDAAGLSDEERALVATELVLMMMDRSLPAAVRGDAIRASYYVNEEPGITSALLTLLEPEEWFFGVTGHHHAEQQSVRCSRSAERSPRTSEPPEEVGERPRTTGA